MGRAAVLGGAISDGPSLGSSVSHGRFEARSNPAICGPGDAVGVKLDVDPVKRSTVNVGSDLMLPVPASGLLVEGQAQCPLLRQVVAEPPYYSEVGKAGHMGKGGSMNGSTDGGKEVVVE